MAEYLDIPFSIKSEDIAEDGMFSGMGSLFDNEPDAHRDLVARGAFSETLIKGGRNKTGIMMGWQHDTRGMPPGVWLDLREEPKGLFAKGQIALDTALGKDAYSIMKLGAKTGMWRFSLSIGYDPIESEYQKVKVGDATIDVRLLKKVDLWEVSIVNFPAKLGANIITVKSIEDAKTERELELVLRESGLSKSAAQYVVKLCKPSLREAENRLLEQGMLSEILEGLKKVNNDLNGFLQSAEVV